MFLGLACRSFVLIRRSGVRFLAIPPMTVFDAKAKRIQRDRAALNPDADLYEYIRDEVAERLADRTYDIPREFSKLLDLGCNKGNLGKFLSQDKIKEIVFADSSRHMLERACSDAIPYSRVVIDEEFLPFGDNVFDMVISSCSLHWVNNLPQTFSEVLRVLKPDGVFLGAMLGGKSLHQLSVSFQLAEIERHGGMAPHVSPFVEMADVGSLLREAGFNISTIDFDVITIRYPSMIHLMADLQGMGESNASIERRYCLSKDLIIAGSSVYQGLYGDADGCIPADFYVIYLIGWKHSADQARPKPRGSAQQSFKDLSKVMKELRQKKAS